MSISNRIRGFHYVPSNEKLYVVVGTALSSITSAGTATAIGEVGGSGRVGMSDNGTQLVITSVGISYVHNMSTGAFSAITDNDFPNSRTVSFKGGYFVFTNSQSGTKGQFFISALYDGSDFDALDFATAEYDSDDIVREFVDHDQLIFFGTNTIQFGFQTVDTFPFAFQQGAVVEKGLGARWSVAKFDNSVVFLDNSGRVQRLGSGEPQRISTHEVEYAISQGPWRTDDTNSIEGAYAYSYVDEGHEFYVLTVPGTCTKVYDASTGLWHDRKSYGYEYSRFGFYANAFGKHIVGDVLNDTIYEQSLDVYQENSQPIVSELIFPQLNQENKRFIVHSFQLDMEVGVGNANAVDPQIMLDVSGNTRTYDLTQLWRSAGKLGEFDDRVIWRILGQHRNFTPRITISDPVKRAVFSAYADVELCD